MHKVDLSDEIWDRLSQHAQLLVHLPEDIISKALDALDAQQKNDTLPPAEATISAPAKPIQKPALDKSLDYIQQKMLRRPLLEAMTALGGKADVAVIRDVLEKRLSSRLTDKDWEPVGAAGDPRWWNATAWARKYFIDVGVFAKGTRRGRWELSRHGRQLARRLQARGARRPATTDLAKEKKEVLSGVYISTDPCTYPSNLSSINQTSEREFRSPLLVALYELGGRAHVNKIRHAMLSTLSDRLTEEDYRPVDHNLPRWWNTTRWVRHQFVAVGLFQPKERRGIWELTERGFQMAEELMTHPSPQARLVFRDSIVRS